MLVQLFRDAHMSNVGRRSDNGHMNDWGRFCSAMKVLLIGVPGTSK